MCGGQRDGVSGVGESLECMDQDGAALAAAELGAGKASS